MKHSAVSIARSALSGVFFISYGLFALPFAVLLLVPVWPKCAVRAVVRIFYRLFVFMARITGLFRIAISGADAAALKGMRGKIIVANHISLIDIVVLMAILPDSTAIAKSATLKNPFLAMTVRSMFIVNDEGAAETLDDVRRYLERGVNVIVFPEGTRTLPDAAEHRLHRGAARLQLATRGEIAAVHLDYDPIVLSKSQSWWDVGEKTIVVSISFRGTFAADGENDHHRAIEVTEIIKERIL